RIEAIRLFLTYASFMGFTVYQMDVKSAFLYGTIDEEVEFEALMHKKFQMSVMGELNFFLGLQVLKKEDGIFLSQDKHQVTPKECHLHAVKRIFRDLKDHPKLGLWYPKDSPFDLIAYSDSDYGGASQDHKSTTEGCQLLAASCCGQVLWIQNQLLDYGEFEALMDEKFQMSAMGELNFFLGLSVLQKEDVIFLSQDKYVGDILKKFRYSDTIVATSTTEAEYVAAASCCGQVLWIQNQLLDYGEIPVLSCKYWNG
nr:hypothetical protein [Tanacetum cinerariifolium]